MHKEIRNSVVWLFFAFFVLATTIWEAQVSAAKDLVEKQRTLPPPRKTKHAIRPAPKEFTGDVVADYVARCKKGMTDKEIGWILEDFENAGLNFNWEHSGATDIVLISARASQQRWYRLALEDGLRLSPEQSTLAARKLSEHFGQATKNFIGSQHTGPDITDGLTPNEAASSYLSPSIWLFDPAGSMMPWFLCQLSPAQESLTWKYWAEKLRSAPPDPKKLSETTGGPVFLTPEPTVGLSNFPTGFSIPINLPNAILPLLDAQPLSDSPDPFAEPTPENSGKLLENIRRLHPAQFKLVLLFDPEIADQIEDALVKIGRSFESR